MAYFSNGEEGMIYEDTYCAKCVHRPDYDNQVDCPILTLHSLWNYDAANGELAQVGSAELAKYTALNILIPRSSDHLTNEQCKMFRAVKPEGSR